MKFLPLVWAMLWRSRTRTWLTFLSIAVAFFLFGLLQTILVLFEAGARYASADNLFVTARNGVGQSMPIAYRQRIESVPGVLAVTPVVPMAAWYQDPQNPIQAMAVDPSFFDWDRRFLVPPPQAQSVQQSRTGVLVGRALAQRYGWTLGDRIPIQSATPKDDGSTTWEFEIAGFYEFNPDVMGRFEALNLFINYDYLDEARLFDKGQVLLYIVRIADPAQADAVSAAIDRLFWNSSAETRTQTESMFGLNQAREFADVGLIVHGILSAVFFTLALVAGNTMMQAFRERIPELAVMKTIGFGDGRVAALVIAEALLLALGAGAAGLLLAAVLVPTTLTAIAPGGFPALAVGAPTLAAGIALAVALGLATALIPAWKARRITVVAALAGE